MLTAPTPLQRGPCLPQYDHSTIIAPGTAGGFVDNGGVGPSAYDAPGYVHSGGSSSGGGSCLTFFDGLARWLEPAGLVDTARALPCSGAAFAAGVLAPIAALLWLRKKR